MDESVIRSSVQDKGLLKPHKDIHRARSNPLEATGGGSGGGGGGVTFVIDNPSPQREDAEDAHPVSSLRTYAVFEPLSATSGDEAASRLRRSKTLGHQDRCKSRNRSYRENGVHNSNRLDTRSSSFRNNSRQASVKSGVLLQSLDNQREPTPPPQSTSTTVAGYSERSPTHMLTVYDPYTSFTTASAPLQPCSSTPLSRRNSSRASSQQSHRSTARSRRQSAWSTEQIRDDWSDVTNKYANPETELAVSALLLILGTVFLIISFGNEQTAWYVIGILLLVSGVLAFLFGILWYYRKSQRTVRLHQKTRAKLLSINAALDECQSMLSEQHSPAHSPYPTHISDPTQNPIDSRAYSPYPTQHPTQNHTQNPAHSPTQSPYPSNNLTHTADPTHSPAREASMSQQLPENRQSTASELLQCSVQEDGNIKL